MTDLEEIVLSSCKRYIDTGISNKYVNEYYNKITGETLEDTDEAHLKPSLLFFKNNTRLRVTYGLLFLGLLVDAISGFIVADTIISHVIIWVVIICLILLYQILSRSKKVEKLYYSRINCIKAKDNVVDYAVGRGYIKL